MSNKSLTIVSLVVAFLLGVLITNFSIVLAQGGSTDVIHGCVKSNGDLRIILATNNCKNNETPLDWNIQGPPGVPGTGENVPPFTCLVGDLHSVGNRYVGKDFTNAVIVGCAFYGVNLSDTNFQNAYLQGERFDGVDFTNANLSDAFMATDFSNSNFTNANLTNAEINHGIFVNANMSGAILTGAVWIDTICPDGTNSDNNNETCEGHLVP